MCRAKPFWTVQNPTLISCNGRALLPLFVRFVGFFYFLFYCIRIKSPFFLLFALSSILKHNPSLCKQHLRSKLYQSLRTHLFAFIRHVPETFLFEIDEKTFASIVLSNLLTLPCELLVQPRFRLQLLPIIMIILERINV